MPGLPSFVFVWPSNCGFSSFTDMTAASPSRTSSPSRLSSFFRSFRSCAFLFSVLVSALRKPDRCEPPSPVLMLLANVNTDSWYELFHCIATSAAPCSLSLSK